MKGGNKMIKNIFQVFCSNIEISHDNTLTIYENMKNIATCVDEYFNNQLATENSQYIGSYGRNTAIYTENIRLLTILPEEMYWKLSLGINTILSEMKKSLTQKYRSCEYSENGNGLNININGNLSFEIVPGFMFDNGKYIYLCNSMWRNLNLDAERKNFSQVNMKVNNNLVELCRILKVWKNYQNLDISNILLDTLAYHFFKYQDEKEYSFDTYDEMLVDFFKYLLQNSKKDSFISFDGETVLKRRIDLYEKAFFSVTTAQTALDTANCGMVNESIKDWKKILGYSMFL